MSRRTLTPCHSRPVFWGSPMVSLFWTLTTSANWSWSCRCTTPSTPGPNSRLRQEADGPGSSGRRRRSASGDGRRREMISSAEGEAVGLGAGAEELDLDQALPDRVRLADQLIQALVGQRPVASLVDVEPTAVAGCLPIEEHAERHLRPARRRPHHEVDIAGLELERDPRTSLVRHG